MTRFDIELDLDGFSDPPPTADAVGQLWADLEPALAGRRLTAGQELRLAAPARGGVGGRVLSAPDDPAGADSRFAVRGVRGRRPATACGTCGWPAGGRCDRCRREGRPGFVCAAHMTALEGRPEVLCPDHVPTCAGGRPAFWCLGDRCRGTVAWPADERAAGGRLCRGCHADRFPPCAAAGCRAVGTVRCEHVADGTACGRPVCPRHAVRWMIHGPDADGAGLCGEHRSRLAAADPPAVARLVAAVTALRRLSGRPIRLADDRTGFPPLPSVAGFRHTLLNVYRTRKVTLDEADAALQAAAAEAVAAADSPLVRAVRDLFARHDGRRRADLDRHHQDMAEGERVTDRVRAFYRAEGLPAVADGLVFEDYRRAAGLLFVALPDHLRRPMIGAGGGRVRAAGAAAGVTIRFERDG